ncbi:MAG: hypothetical protein PWP39_1609 [Pyrococcus sp.]|nr:hypothetical protein [Pyrococcus sp.]
MMKFIRQELKNLKADFIFWNVAARFYSPEDVGGRLCLGVGDKPCLHSVSARSELFITPLLSRVQGASREKLHHPSARPLRGSLNGIHSGNGEIRFIRKTFLHSSSCCCSCSSPWQEPRITCSQRTR